MSIIERYNAVDVSDRLSQAQASGTTKANLQTGTATQNNVAIPIMEEQLQVGKRQVERGGVRIYSHVTERPVEAEVRLREEHVHVERRPVDRSVSDADMAAFKEGVIEVTETSEEAVVSKQARVVEEVVVGKDVRERSETVRDTVRRTDVDVEEVDSKQAKGAKGSRS
ncbi:MAG: YsnF/AvaK domain-containing protein [Acidobacteriota bacterium]|nr:YsnF/AvaK domain-containing protein [Acidobacteriota bacterium]